MALAFTAPAGAGRGPNSAPPTSICEKAKMKWGPSEEVLRFRNDGGPLHVMERLGQSLGVAEHVTPIARLIAEFG